MKRVLDGTAEFWEENGKFYGFIWDKCIGLFVFFRHGLFEKKMGPTQGTGTTSVERGL